MNILYHHRTRLEDGQGVHITEIIEAFKSLNHNIEIVAIVRSADGMDNEGRKESVVSKIASLVPPWLYELFEITYNLYGGVNLLHALSKLKPDFIYERYSLFTFVGVITAKLFKIPLFLEVNSPLSIEKRKHSVLVFKRFARFTERLICSNAYKTIVVSTPLKKILLKNGVPEDKIVVIPNGVNKDVFSKHIDGQAVRDKFNLNGKIVVGFVGWFRRWHGLEDLIRVFSDYKMHEKNIHLLMVGDGPSFESLKNYAKNGTDCADCIHFTGPVPRSFIPQYIACDKSLPDESARIALVKLELSGRFRSLPFNDLAILTSCIAATVKK